MNKKFLSAILFGALMVSSTGTFVSCKDYDDDIDEINSELVELKSAIAALQQKVDAGKYVTNVTKSGEGIVITWNDGATSTIETIKGETGADGKNGTVVTIIDGYWAFDGVKSEYPAKGDKGDKGDTGAAGSTSIAPEIRDGEWYVWDAEKGDYVPTGFVAGNVTAVATDGGYNFTINGETLFIADSAVMGYIDILSEKDLEVLYATSKIKKDTIYGPLKKTYEVGFYSALNADLKIVVNPQGTDASDYAFSLLNSKNENTGIEFEEAVPYKGLLTTRTTSDNGIWVLPHKFSYYENEREARTENYLLFKDNNTTVKHMLSLTAKLEQNTVKTPFDLIASLKKYDSTNDHVSAAFAEKAEQNKWYTPVVSGSVGAVYDWWLSIPETSAGIKESGLYGIEIDEEKFQSVRFTKEAGVNNKFVLTFNYITIEGLIKSFNIEYFDMTVGEEASKNIVLEPLITALDASWSNNKDSVADENMSKNRLFIMTTDKYSVKDEVEAWDALTQALWKERSSVTYEVVGGDEAANSEKNLDLAKHVVMSFSKSATTMKYNDQVAFTFKVSAGYAHNFELGKAYEVIASVKKDGEVVATITLPFEFSMPTMDIKQVDGDFVQWKNDATYGRTLMAYGAYGTYNEVKHMYVPLFDALSAWTTEWTEYDANAAYYNLWSNEYYGNALMGKQDTAEGEKMTLDNALKHDNQWKNWDTKSWVAANGEGNRTEGVEDSLFVNASYKHYGVYEDKSALGTYKKVKNGEDEVGFRLKFASLLKHSTIKVEKDYVGTAGKNAIWIPNSDIKATTPMGEAFYLFDGLDQYGEVEDRANLNRVSFNESLRPFDSVDEIIADGNIKVYNYLDGDKTGADVTVGTYDDDADGNWSATGKWMFDKGLDAGSDLDDVTIYAVAPVAAVVNEDGVVTKEAHDGGIIIQLPDGYEDNQKVKVVLTISDKLGYTNTLEIIVSNLN